MSRYQVSLTHFPIQTEMQSLHPTLANAIASARLALDHAYRAYLSRQTVDVIINSQIDVFGDLLEQGDWLTADRAIKAFKANLQSD